MESGLAGRHVLVTGASGGIGAEIARMFAAEGARTTLHYRSGRDRAETIAADLGDAPHALEQADLTNETEVEALFDRATSRFGPVEVLVANAGVWPPQFTLLADMSLVQWESTLRVDLTSVFLTARRFLRDVREHGLQTPALVMIGSTAAVFGEAGHADYAAAKAGLSYGLLATLKNEMARLAPRGRVNCVCPGWTVTPMTRKFADDESARARALKTIAMNKFASPTDIASTVLFLASDRLAGHLTGERLVVSGGMEGRVLNDPS